MTKTYRGDISQYLRVGHTILIQPQMPAFVKWCNEVIVHIFYNIYDSLRVVYWITLVSHIWVKQNAIARLTAASDVTMQCQPHPQSESGWLKFVAAPVIRTEMPQNQPTQPQQLSRQNSNNGSRCGNWHVFYLFTTVSCHPWIKQSNRSIPIVLVYL